MNNRQESAATSDKEKLRKTYHSCIVGSHILHYNGILDAYGHLSARHPTDPTIFIMPRSTAPANVSSHRDLVQYRVADGSPVDPDAPRGYLERFIHSEIYRRFPEINGVVHSHASEVIPYANTAVPLRPCIHMAGFLGKAVPTFDISKHYVSDDIRDLLIRNVRLGGDLAAYLENPSSNVTPTTDHAQADAHAVVLMRGHGYTAVGATPEEAVYRAIYTKLNASIQTASLGLAASAAAVATQSTARMGREAMTTASLGAEYLRGDELEDTLAMSRFGWERAWGLWVREVEAADLYSVKDLEKEQ